MGSRRLRPVRHGARRLVIGSVLATGTALGLVPGHPVAEAASSSAGVSAAANPAATVPVAVAPTADGQGFWVASTDGAVTAEGEAVGYGDASGVSLAAPVVGIATTATGRGYWLLGSDGGVLSYGDAKFFRLHGG